MAGNGKKKPISISLPRQAIDLLDRLAATGLYANNRAGVASELIQEALRDWVKRGAIELPSRDEEAD